MRPVAAARTPRPIGRVHWLGLWTLFRRELWRTLKFWVATIAAAAFNAVLYLAIMVFALGPDRGTEAGAAALRFLLPGLVLLTVMLRAAETPAFSLVLDKLERIVSDVLMPPLTPSEMAAAYAGAGAVSGLIAGLPVLAVAVLGFDMPLGDPPLMALVAAGGALMLSLAGILVGIASVKWDHVSAAFSFGLVPLVFLSGLFAPVETLPGPLAAALRFSPIFYVIDAFRAAALGVSAAPVWLSLAVIAAADALLWLVCDRLFRAGWRLRG